MTPSPAEIARPVQRAYHHLKDKGGIIASIALREGVGLWFFELCHQQRGGDCWGSFGLQSRESFASEDAALAGAIAYARARWAGREAEMAPHFAWLDTLVPEQPDLFSSGADQ